MDVFSNPEKGSYWLDDPYVFAQLKQAITIMLDQLQPTGAPTPLADSSLELLPDTYVGRLVAANLLSAVKAAPPGVLPIKTVDQTGIMPAGETWPEESWPAARIRSDLGTVADRISISAEDPARAVLDFCRAWVPMKEGETDEAWRHPVPSEISALRKAGSLPDHPKPKTPAKKHERNEP